MRQRAWKTVVFSAALLACALGYLLAWPRSQKLVYFISSDGKIGDSVRALISIGGYVLIACGLAGLAAARELGRIPALLARLGGAFARPSPRSWMTGIAVLAFALRLAWGLYLPNAQVSDFARYDREAKQLASGVSLLSPEITASIPPGYPLALSAVYRIFGSDERAAKAFNALLGACLCLAAYLLSRETAGEGVARVASLLAAVYPTLVLSVSLVASEHLFAPLFVIALFLLARAERMESPGLFALAGFAMGLACLAKMLVYPFPAFVVAWMFFRREPRLKSWLARSAVYFLAFLVPLVPWQWRNREVFGRWGIMATYTGAIVYLGSVPDYREVSAHQERLAAKNLNEYEADQELKRLAIENVRRNWRFTVKYFFSWKLRREFVDPPEWLCEYGLKTVAWPRRRTEFAYAVIFAFSAAAHAALSALAVCGVAISWRRSRYSSLLVLPILFAAAWLIVSVAAPRYRYHFLPIYLHFAAWTLVVAWRKIVGNPKIPIRPL